MSKEDKQFLNKVVVRQVIKRSGWTEFLRMVAKIASAQGDESLAGELDDIAAQRKD